MTIPIPMKPTNPFQFNPIILKMMKEELKKGRKEEEYDDD